MAGIQPPVISGVDFIVTLILSVRRRRLMWPPDQFLRRFTGDSITFIHAK